MIVAIILISGLLGFWQERGANRVVASLMDVVSVRVEVVRDGRVTSCPLADVVPGDIVELNAGDVLPGDGVVVESNSLLVSQEALTGETFPVEKTVGVSAASGALAERNNAVFMGTHVASGAGRVLIVATGAQTEFGRVSGRLATQAGPTSFEKGMTAFGLLLVRVMLVLVASIFVINLVLGRPFLDSALFSLALAVGLTPQLLPAIVTISLSEGARAMAAKRVIVRRLDSIEDFGSMTALCTDKTGTMTSGQVVLDRADDVAAQPSDRVRRLAMLNAALQSGFANPIDDAIVAAAPASQRPTGERLAELPYDFKRRRLSVLVKAHGESADLLITKGALEDVVKICSSARDASGASADVASVTSAIHSRYEELSAQGYRVLGLATKPLPDRHELKPDDESGMTFEGYLTFADPPKADAAQTIADLAAAGVSVRMITGDNPHVAAHVAGMVGLPDAAVVTGTQMATLDDAALVGLVGKTYVFAQVDPEQKERLIKALRGSGAIVGYLGDGINDAPALHAADVGISVDSAVDVAKQAAAIVLLDKDLRVLLDGVRQGRRTFANTIKYIYTTISANFGNMISMAGASLILPFLPLLAAQILLINFLTDFPATTIATDSVDPEQIARPQTWNLGTIARFMTAFGAISSVFDFLTFGVLIFAFNADAPLFRSGWFLKSVVTELAVLFVLRTRRPFFRSRPSLLLAGSSLVIGVVTVLIVYAPFGTLVELQPLPVALLVTLLAITGGYVITAEIGKRLYYRRWPTG